MRLNFNTDIIPKTKQPYIQILFIKIFIIGLFLPITVSNITLFSLVFFWIISGEYRLSLQQLKQKRILTIFLGLYALHIIGLVYTDNWLSAYKELEKKIPLLLLPLVIASMRHETLASKRKEILDFYAKTTAITCLILVFYAFFRYTVTHNTEVFYFKEFTKLIQVNPIYVAMYVLFAFGIYFYELNPDETRIAWIKKGIIYILTVIVLMFISSKTALIVFILFSLHIIFSHFKNLNRMVRAAFAFAAVVSIIAAINYFPVTKERINNLFESDWSGAWEDDYAKNAKTFTGYTVRVSFWKAALNQLTDDGLLWQGAGTGDSMDYLNKAYENASLIAIGYADFNLHNAFMEVILEFGIVGLAIYLTIWITVGVYAIRGKDQALILLLIVFLFFSMTESILYVNKGLTFFAFWVSLLVNFFYIGKIKSQQQVLQ